MTNGDRERLAEWAVIALLVVALAGVAGGITVAYLGGAVARSWRSRPLRWVGSLRS